MGTSYSQPPRGYKYSEQPVSSDIPPYEPQFETFSEIYQEKYATTKQLPFLQLNDQLVSFEACANMSAAMMTYLRSNAPALESNGILAIYSATSIEAIITLITSFLYGLKCHVYNPNKMTTAEFAKEANAKKPAVIFCTPENARKIREQVHNAFVFTDKEVQQKVISTRRQSQRIELPAVDKDSVVLGVNNHERTGKDVVAFIPEWVKRFKLSRDASVACILDIDSPLIYVVLAAAVYCRCRLFFANSLNEIAQFNPTHLFISSSVIKQEEKDITDNLAAKWFGWKLGYGVGYSWKKFWLNWGSQAPKTDKKYFEKIRKDLGSELRFIFADSILNREMHELVMTVYGKPIVNVFLPTEWGNLGASLPCDIRFIKLGTAGSPIAPRITIDQESKKLVGHTVDGVVELKNKGFWDEEGALIVE